MNESGAYIQQKISQRAADDAGRPIMRVKVYAPHRTYFEGEAYSMSAENATGLFDVLPRHHHFMSLLNPCIMTIRSVKAGDQMIRISGGLLHVKADRATVFLDV